AMRAPTPLALGCISLVLCLLELPGSSTLPCTPARPRRPGRAPRPRQHQALQPPRGAQPRPRAGQSPAVPLRLGSGVQAPRRAQPHGPGAAERGSTPGCVQNLSHRLWQLVGQSGRQDSSPMNPNSPHSYG
uniref:Uncharacterized protein n=1 Tax=Apteryx owenii TaxID=8824 RepID=A0A8B9S7Q3_APTOW